MPTSLVLTVLGEDRRRLSTAVCDDVLQRHGLARRPHRRKGCFTQASAYCGHIAVIPDTLAGRQGSTSRLAQGLCSAQEPCSALQLLLRHRHPRQALEALGQAVFVPEFPAQRQALLIERRRPAIVALRVRHRPQAMRASRHAPLESYSRPQAQTLFVERQSPARRRPARARRSPGR